MSDENDVNHFSEADTTGRVFNLSLTPSDDSRTKKLYASSTKIIPVVYIHGMLSAALKAKGQEGKKDGQNVWTAPSGIGALGTLLGSMETFCYNAAKHQIKLDPNTTEVDYDASFQWWYDSVDKDVAKERGWGAVWKASEQPFLDKLQGSLNQLRKIDLDKISDNKNEFDWYALLNTKPEQYGGISNQAAQQVSKDDLKIMQKYQFDVWVAAYNWLDAHETQAEKVLLPRIRDKILGSYKELPDPPEKVLVITHSLGGIASRTFTQIKKFENMVWGVSHSCQPAEGAPTAYHHVRCGYDGVAGLVLGQGSNYVTPLLANGMGVMALLPFPSYQNSEPWLFVNCHDDSTNETSFISFPQKSDGSDIFDSVYKSRAWYGLLPKRSEDDRYDEQFLNPAGLDNRVDTYDKFCDQLDIAKTFQKNLHKGGYHKMTFAHAESQDFKNTKTWAHGQWEVKSASKPADFATIIDAKIEADGYISRRFRMSSNELLLSDNSKACYLPTKSLNGWYDPYLPSSIHYNHKSKERIGTIASKGVMTSQYEHLSCAGDNTVAAGSGEAPYMAKVKGGYFMHGTAYAHKELRDKYLAIQNNTKQSNSDKPLIPHFSTANYEHATALADPLPYFSTLHAIVKIVVNVVDKEWGD